MAQVILNFPRGFMWGTATAAHQVEGNNINNNWHAWEKSGHIVDRHSCGLACDWWGGRWREDFDRAVESGQNAHRLSVEWSRIQPEENRWDEDALDYYRQCYERYENDKRPPLSIMGKEARYYYSMIRFK